MNNKACQIFNSDATFHCFVLFLPGESMKNELPICDERLKMKWNSQVPLEQEINSYPVLPVCSLIPEIQRFKQIVTIRKWLPATAALHMLRVWAAGFNWINKQWQNSCAHWFVCHIPRFRNYKTCASGLKRWGGGELGMFGPRNHSSLLNSCWIRPKPKGVNQLSSKLGTCKCAVPHKSKWRLSLGWHI